MEHFNGLTPAEAERLALLIEEAGEVVQAAGKVLRHGYESYNPKDPGAGSNRVQLNRELLDLYTVIQMMLNAGDVDYHEANDVAAARERKAAYLHHQEVQS